MTTKHKVFLGQVEIHERAWADEPYPNRPSLEAILNAHLVAFWKTNERRDHGYRISIHEDIEEIHQYVSTLVLDSKVKMPDRRLYKLFAGKIEVKIKGVRLDFELVGKR